MNSQQKTRVQTAVAMLTLCSWQAGIFAQEVPVETLDGLDALLRELGRSGPGELPEAVSAALDSALVRETIRESILEMYDGPSAAFATVAYSTDGCSVRPMVPDLFVMPTGLAEVAGILPGDDGVFRWQPPETLPTRFGVPVNPGFVWQGRVYMPHLAAENSNVISSGMGLTSDYFSNTVVNPSDPEFYGSITMDVTRSELNESSTSVGESVLPGGALLPVTDPGDENDSPTSTSTSTDPGEASDTPPSPTFPLYVKATTKVQQPDGTTTSSPVPGAQIQALFPPGRLPLSGEVRNQQGFDEDPVQGTTDDDGLLALFPYLGDAESTGSAGDDVPPDVAEILAGLDDLELAEQIMESLLQSVIQFDMEAERYSSVVFQGAPGTTMEDLIDMIPVPWQVLYMHQGQLINNVPFLTLTWPESADAEVVPYLEEFAGSEVVTIEENYCRAKQLPNDPSFMQAASRGRLGSWGQPYDDQWAIKRVGLTGEQDSAWNLLGENPAPVNVAVIDTGLDWNHLDISWDNIWKNEVEIPNNGIDEDGNGYIDDIIGWDVLTNNNLPWDYDGHGTVVAGIIAAEQDNGVGIAGINPYAKLMVLKVLNEFGNSRASYIAESIVYAVDNGARIVNISVGGANFSTVERAAVEYANEKGVLIIAAAGNEGRTLDDYGPGGLSGVVTVAATDQEDVRTIFSNWGQQVDLAAPGIDVLSLRARRTDTMRDIPDVEYLAGGAYVGEDNRYYRASGTSFAAPIVSGIASLVLSKDPDLSREQLHRILTQSATDTEIPGKDQYTGYGIINAAAALSIDRDHFIDALISGVSVVEENGEVQLVLSGTANADDFRRARIEIGAGESPDSWKRVGDEIEEPVVDGQLGTIPAEEFAGSTQWVLRLVTEHDDRTEREAWFLLTLG